MEGSIVSVSPRKNKRLSDPFLYFVRSIIHFYCKYLLINHRRKYKSVASKFNYFFKRIDINVMIRVLSVAD